VAFAKPLINKMRAGGTVFGEHFSAQSQILEEKRRVGAGRFASKERWGCAIQTSGEEGAL
jgi:hypothetical protein